MFRVPQLIALAAGFVVPMAPAEDAPNDASTATKEPVSGDSLSTTALVAFIAHSLVVPEFAPPDPAPPKQAPAMLVNASTTVPSSNGKTLTILRGEASTLPDIPPPVEPRPVVKRLRTSEDLAREIYRRRHTISLAATVYDDRVSVVRWQHPDSREPYEAICGFDVGLLEGIGQFVRNGESYSVMLMHSRFDSTRLRRFAAPAFPDLSSVPENSLRYLKGDADDLIGTSPVTLIQELIINEKARLKIFQSDRDRHQEARAEWERANPIPARDETFWIRPHRGSRYLADPKPQANAR